MYQALEKLDPNAISSDLAASAARFLARYGTAALMGRDWGGLLAETAEEVRFETLISACGYAADAKGFFAEVFRQVRSGAKTPVRFRGRELPQLLVYHLLETALPGQALYGIRTQAQLRSRTGLKATKALQTVMETYPVRLSAHAARQSMVSEAVAVQYLPFEDELDPLGHELTFDGHFKQGLMEQMYRNRAIFLLDMRCPVFCRFCFRKHKSLRKEASPDIKAVASALDRVRQNPEIKEVLITGGEPLLNMRNLKAAVNGLMTIPHVRTLRIATRSLAYFPHLFRHHNGQVVSFLKSVHNQCRAQGKHLEIGVHMVHPDEISVQALEIISDFTASGIPVYVQTPFLMKVNPDGPALGELFSRLRMAGAQIYYIFTPCHPIYGTRKYWSPISVSLKAYAWLRQNLSDRCMPKLCTATPLGKMEWHTSGWAVERDSTDPDHIWIRTPYTAAYFKPMMGDRPLPVETRENPGGTLDVKCLIDMGDPTLFFGDQGPAGMPCGQGKDRNGLPDPAGQELSNRLAAVQQAFFQAESFLTARPGNGPGCLTQTHRTRVDITLTPDLNLTLAASHLSALPDVTDVVVRIPETHPFSLDDELSAVENTVRVLAGLNRPLWVRLQWAAVQRDPDCFGDEALARISALARFDIAAPLRLEFETWWLVPEQILADHAHLFSRIGDAGLGVYANTALISGLNTDPAVAEALAHRIREAGMEFHQVYTSGLALQKTFDPAHPVAGETVVALASRIRMNCTGREVPLYVFWQPGGERDFGLGQS